MQRHRGKGRGRGGGKDKDKDIARNTARVKENCRGGNNIKGKKNVLSGDEVTSPIMYKVVT